MNYITIFIFKFGVQVYEGTSIKSSFENRENCDRYRRFSELDFSGFLKVYIYVCDIFKETGNNVVLEHRVTFYSGRSFQTFSVSTYC